MPSSALLKIFGSGVIDSGVTGFGSGVIDSGVTGFGSGVIDSGVIGFGSGVIDSGVIDSGVTDSGVIDFGSGVCLLGLYVIGSGSSGKPTATPFISGSSAVCSYILTLSSSSMLNFTMSSAVIPLMSGNVTTSPSLTWLMSYMSGLFFLILPRIYSIAFSRSGAPANEISFFLNSFSINSVKPPFKYGNSTSLYIRTLNGFSLFTSLLIIHL